MKKDLTELKKITFDLMNNEENSEINTEIFNDVYEKEITATKTRKNKTDENVYTLASQEKKLIKQSLEKHNGKRKLALKNLVSLKELYIEK